MAVTLTLGGVVFQDFEVPDTINSGGQQMLVVHKMPGGERVIDAMGPDDDDIQWSGRFRGPSAEERALLLDSLRTQGDPLLLTWSLHRYRVVIRHFKADFQQAYEIPYSITCAVLLDETQRIASTAIGFIESLAGDLVSAVGLDSLIGSDSIHTAIAGVTSALSNYQAGVPNTTNALASVTSLAEGPLLDKLQTSLTGAQTATQAGIVTTNAAINTTPVTAGGIATDMAVALRTAADGFGNLANLHQISSVIGRMAINTSNAGQ